MAEKMEMPVGEWAFRLMCKLFALGVAILGFGGSALIYFTVLGPLIDGTHYSEAVCVGIALIAAMMFGSAPMAVMVEKVLLRLLGGLQPLPRSDKQ
ncbi:hypothetical protein [Paraburkholderia sp. GAS32]|uniref:hypothetical protein n=1 Tax=Paraburkholderia sp. GAS32 TaxID=3035129 RepID=UPI003D1BB075